MPDKPNVTSVLVRYFELAADGKMEEYQVALGEFLLAFNGVDQLLSEIIELTLTEGGFPALGKRSATRPYEQKIDLIDLLAEDDGRLVHGVKDRLKALGRERNLVAHGAIIRDYESGGLLIKRGDRPVDRAKLEDLKREAQSLHEVLIGLWLELYMATPAGRRSLFDVAENSDRPIGNPLPDGSS